MSSSAVSAGVNGQPDGPAKIPGVIPVICGPTASGKSRIARWLAERHDILIISADSRQVYRHFDVGTAKPSQEEQSRIPHRGIDVVEPTDRYSAAQWAALAERAIADAFASGRLPVVVGGTGFYMRALFRPLWAEPPLDPERRAVVQAQLGALSLEELRRWCASLDPARAHLGRAQLLRSIEVALLTGGRLSDMHATRARTGAWRGSYLLVDPGAALSALIATRAASMFDGGWVEETRELVATIPADAPAWNATGYRVVRECVTGDGDRASALDRIVIETRQYAKRQRTWFRHQLESDRVQHLDPQHDGWMDTVEKWIAALSTRRVTATSP